MLVYDVKIEKSIEDVILYSITSVDKIKKNKRFLSILSCY
jgi:hypothetical protein